MGGCVRALRSGRREAVGAPRPGDARGLLVEQLLLAPFFDVAQLRVAAADQLADRRDAQLALAPDPLGVFESFGRGRRDAQLLVDRLAEPRHEALVALHDRDAAA